MTKSHTKRKRQNKKYKTKYIRRNKRTKHTIKKGGGKLNLDGTLTEMVSNNLTQRRENYQRRQQEIQEVQTQLSTHITNRDVNYAAMLRLVCKNPDNCVDLGQYGEPFKKYFDNFRDLSLIDLSLLKKIGKESRNGFIIELTFNKNQIKAYTILKCALRPSSDNLFYEFYVGKFFINKYLKKMPCFVETYDLYEFKTEQAHRVLSRTNQLVNFNISNAITKVNVDEDNIDELLKESCRKNKQFCILMQYFDNFISIGDAYDNGKLDNDFYNLIYQVYYCLSVLNKNGDYTYTHYDLHADNVFLYKPFTGNTYVSMTYHSHQINPRTGQLEPKTFQFKSEYIVKIIDYGRNYFKTDKTNTTDIVRKICEFNECPNCGKNVGYNIIRGQERRTGLYDPIDQHWINPVIPNISHDMRMANEFLKKQFKRVGFEIVYDLDMGTRPIPTDSEETKRNPDINAHEIFNIFQLRLVLEKMLKSFNLRHQHKYSDWTEVATMNIYDDGRDMEIVYIN